MSSHNTLQSFRNRIGYALASILMLGIACAAASPPPLVQADQAADSSVARDALIDPAVHMLEKGDRDDAGHQQLVRKIAVTLTARQALTAMDHGLLTSREYVDILIDRIEAHSEINAVIAADFDAVRAAADRADQMRADGEPLGPLHGLPVLVKDSYFTEDFPMTAGTPTLEDFQPDFNAPALQALLDAGAILLGKTNLHELQTGFTTNNGFTGPTLNPYDFTRSPGGSSGGNSAALAARLAPLALGGDTGGSVRLPAAFTGTFGFRPTPGRWPIEGVFPLSHTLDNIGPMARDVRDLALADSVVTGESDELEPIAVSELRIGVPRKMFRENLSDEVRQHFQRALRRLDRAGATLVEADIPGAGVDDSLAAWLAIVFFEAPLDLGAFLDENDTGVTLPELIGGIDSPPVAATFRQALVSAPDAATYNAVVNDLLPFLKGLYTGYLAVNDLDAIVYPTVPFPAIGLEEDPVFEYNGQQFPTFETFIRNLHYTVITGAPTVTVPLGQTREQLPAGGMDIAGAPGDDRRVLAVAHAIAQLLPRVQAPRQIRPVPLME